MPLGRRNRKHRSRDPFAHLADERRAAESGDQPWFMGEDDAPELHVETGISSNLGRDDLDLHHPPPAELPLDDEEE
jgi:hypothetical protein